MEMMLKTNELCKTFKDQKAVNKVSLSIPKGCVYGLLGPNGAGKSTLIRHLTGVYKADEGEILIDGEPVFENRNIKQRMAYIPDELFYFMQADTMEMKRFYEGIYPQFDSKLFYKMQEFFPTIDVKRTIRRLSKGMQKQVAFWLAICCKPDILILDEPVDGLDPVMRRQIWSIILSEVAEKEMTVLVSSHNLRELEDVCDHVGIMHHGKIMIERSLSDLQGSVSKIQVACQSGMPKLPEHFQVLHMANTGRVYTMIVKGDPKEAIKKTVSKLKGTFALVILFEDQPDVIYSIRNVSPIVATICKEGAMLASDLTALCRFTNEYFVVPEYHILELHKDHVVLTDLNDNVVEPEFLSVDWELNSAGKNGYPFYMEKEIMEQPEAIKNTIKDRIVNGLPDFTADGVPDSLFTDCDRICVVACGTAMHAGLVAQALVKSIVHVQMDVELASEFMYSDPVIDEKTLVIAVSQSGETIDTLEALKYAKRQGAKCLSVINVKGSSIARESDYVLYTAAGPEIAVASTKAYTTQLSVFYLVVALLRGVYTEEQTKSFIAELERVPEVMQKVLEKRRDIHVIAKKILEAKDLFMIGRGLDYSILLEGSLKLKEVSYIHSEAYASGELKHGPIALITTNTPVVATVTQEKLMSKELSNIKEVKSRGADIVLFIKEALSGDLDTEYQVIKLPDMQDEFMVLPASVALQLLAYYVSSDKGFDVDKPRNLAKVVTVE